MTVIEERSLEVTAEEVSRSLALTSEEGSLGMNAAEDSRTDSPTEL
jgi:hypothetical protein